MEIADDQEDQLPEVNFVPCLKFIRRNVASSKNIADGVKPNVNLATFQEMVGAPSTFTVDDEDDSDEDEEDENPESMTEPTPSSNRRRAGGADEYNFNEYDNETAVSTLKISDVVEVTENDEVADSDNDSDADDDLIKPEDNLVLVGRVEVDCSSLEVYIYNEVENSLYVHHDFILPFPPLCVEWFSYDPGSQGPGNLCAIGGMEPIIQIYDLDIHAPLEPVLKLGKKGSRKKNIKKVGHKDAVLDLSWNSNYQHIIASASVDQTVILWDIENCKPELVLKDFAEKVQSIQFNPEEAEYLLTGSSDNTVKLFDCRQSDMETANFKQWIMEGEVEKVKWNPNDKHYFLVGTNNGKMSYFDSRGTEPLWTIEAHEKEVTDFGFNTQAPSMLTSTSVDGLLKIWKFDGSTCELVQSHHYKLGRIHCLDECPENPFLLGVGGDKRRKNFTVVNSMDFENVKRAFVEGYVPVGDAIVDNGNGNIVVADKMEADNDDCDEDDDVDGDDDLDE